jgi:hypothetical protein
MTLYQAFEAQFYELTTKKPQSLRDYELDDDSANITIGITREFLSNVPIVEYFNEHKYICIKV